MPLNLSQIGSRRPPIFSDADMPRAHILHLRLITLFGEWSSGRISRWTGINPRTLQRWMTLGDGHIPDDEWPEDLAAKISAQSVLVDGVEMHERIQGLIKDLTDRPDGNNIDPEIVASRLAIEYRKLMGREIE